MKLRPPIKCQKKAELAAWIIDHFPKNYEVLDYIEANVGSGDVYLLKNPSNDLEVINDINRGIFQIFRTLRDEPDAFIKKLKTTTLSERVFKREMTKSITNSDLEQAFKEFVLRKLSRDGLKEIYNNKLAISRDKLVKNLQAVSDRLQNTIILNKNIIELALAFNYDKALIYCDLSNEQLLTDDEQIKLAHIFNNTKSKVIISGHPSPLHKRLYKDWKSLKHKKPTKIQKIDCIWINY